MNKTSIISGMIIVFLAFLLSGCLEQSTDNNIERFLGMWNETDPNIPPDIDYFHRVIFYNNGTLNDTYWYEGYDVEEPVTKWYYYNIDGDALCLTQLEGDQSESSCYLFNFSSDEKTLTLTSIEQTQFIVILKKSDLG